MTKQTSKAVLLRLLSSSTLFLEMMILLGVNALKSGNAQRRVAAFSTVAGKHYHSRLSTPIQPQYSAKPYSPPLYRLRKNMLVSRYLSCPTTQLFMSDSNDDDGSTSDEDNSQQQPKASYNIAALKKETSRLIARAIKKVGKVSARVRYAEEQLEKLRAEIDASTSEEVDDELLNKLENAPNIEVHKKEMAELQSRLQKLNWLEEQFVKSPLKGKKVMSREDLQKNEIGSQVVEYVTELEINDDENQKQKRKDADAMSKRSKQQKASETKGGDNETGPRLPYRRYYTENRTEIKVGKQATDNDVLSLSPEHRSGAHWWYHASGCPGSHVVLCTDDASPNEGDVKDAAALAALKSKCIGQSVIKVSMTRCRNVSKPPGAKPGLVQLNGDVKTITLKKDEVMKRTERLEETVIVN
jgi:predicted ribosome quality control (RQC) complex YloA/Tae2 family protein